METKTTPAPPPTNGQNVPLPTLFALAATATLILMGMVAGVISGPE